MVQLRPPGDEVTVYPVIAEPPVLAGLVHVIVACEAPAVALRPVGAPGVLAGITAVDASEAELVPRELVAVMVNV